jgi:hypothetical protein
MVSERVEIVTRDLENPVIPLHSVIPTDLRVVPDEEEWRNLAFLSF